MWITQEKMEEVMRPFIISLLTAVLSVSVFAGYDYTIVDGIWNNITVSGMQTFLMTGGAIEYLTGKDNSILEIRQTSFFPGTSAGIISLILSDSSQLDFSGGYVYKFSPSGDAKAILSGGQIDEIWGSYLFPADASHIKVYCQPGWTYSGGYLSGLWLDNSAFNIKLVTKSGSDIFSNMTIIPEPATLFLLAIGGLLLKRKK